MTDSAYVVTIRDVVLFFRSNILLLCIGMFIGAGGAGIFAFVSAPVYRSSVVVVPTATQGAAGGNLSRIAGRLSGLTSLTGLGVGGDSSSDEALAVLKSREFAVNFIQEEGLLPILFSSKWDGAAGRWKTMNPQKVPTLSDGAKYFDKKLRTVIEDKDRNLITIRVEWKDRELAARWANLMIRKVNEQLRSRKLAELNKSLQYLDREAEKANSVELRQSVFNLIETQLNDRMMASVQEEYAFRVIDPAMQADVDDFISPKRALDVVIGGFIGGLIVFIFAVFRAYWRSTDPSCAHSGNSKQE